ncbi:DNA repair protein endonuclease SAE2/CtIP C-terminus-domain-containing protein [Mycena floridula]|nr:DNA repair protein endonuclease SAE2/CtIP C-terminus-domain-containing protein [Mycena floridula]
MTSPVSQFTLIELEAHDKSLKEKTLLPYKRSIESLERQLSEMQNNGRELAKVLGFKDVMHAILGIADAGGLSYRELINMYRKGSTANSVESEKLKEKLEHEQAARQEAVSQLRDLQSRHDKLVVVNQRSAERYQAEYASWHKFKDWLWDEEELANDTKVAGNKRSPEKRAWSKGRLLNQRSVLQEIGKDPDKLEAEFSVIIPNLPSFEDKENTAMSANVKPQSSLPPATFPLSPAVMSSPLSSATDLTSHRSLKPALEPASKLSAKSFSKPVVPSDLILVPNSSDTEESSQDFPPSPKAAPVIVDVDLTISDTDESQDPSPPPSTQSRPIAQTVLQRSTSKRASGGPPIDPRPAKQRRIGTDFSETPARPLSSKQGILQDKTPLPNRRDEFRKPISKETPKGSSSKRPPATSPRDSGKAVSKKTSIASSSKMKLDDYSMYKGHGRYAQSNAAAEKSINTVFEIDPEKNGGLDYQYDEVVRTKAARKRMHGGDCECCRDYYEMVGPMPPRLQPPLWRSPTSSPAPCRAGETVESSKKRDAVEAHKTGISRHRHHWAPTNTPPGYWNIAFPNTQETIRINAEAAKMHERKREEIEREAKKSDGRYKKRR